MARWIGVLVFFAIAAMAGATKTLRLACWEGAEALKSVQDAAAEFERAHPGVRVKIEAVPFGNYHEKLLAQYAAGVAPDVSLMNPENFQRYSQRGVIYSLNSFMERDSEFHLKDYYEPIVKAHSVGGQLYVLPRDIAPIGLIYINKKAFAEAGLSLPDGSWTWDFQPRPELREKCFTWVMQQLTQRAPDGKTTRYGFTPAWPGAFIDLLVYSQGARYADSVENPTKARFDDPRIIQAYAFFQDLSLKQKVIPSPSALSTELMVSPIDLFLQGKVAMAQSGIWEVPNIRKRHPTTSKDWFDWDIVLAPAFRDGTRAMPTGGSGYCIFKSTPYPEDAWKLVKWMAGAPAMQKLAAAGLAQPAIRALAVKPPWIPDASTPREEQFPKNRIITDTAVPSVVFEPTSSAWPEVKAYATQAIDQVLLGTLPAEKGMKDAQKRAQDRLDVILKQEDLKPFPWAMAGLLGLVVLIGVGAWVFAPERGRKLTAREKAEARAAFGFLTPWLFGLIALTLGPMVFSFMMSFSDWDIIQPARWRGAQNYQEAFSGDPRFWVSLKVTAIYTAVAVPLGLLVSLALALLLNVKVKGMPLYRTFFYIPALASGVASALIWRGVFKADGGLLNTIIYGSDGRGDFLGLASALAPLGQAGDPINWLGNEKTALASLILMSLWGAGGGMVVLLAGLQGIPQHYYEASTIDGAGIWGRFRHVTIPMLGPALMFSLITGLIGSFQVFTNAFIMTAGGPGESTMFYMLHLYNNAFVGLRMGYASALAWILFILILGLTVAQLRLNRMVYYEGDLR